MKAEGWVERPAPTLSSMIENDTGKVYCHPRPKGGWFVTPDSNLLSRMVEQPEETDPFFDTPEDGAAAVWLARKLKGEDPKQDPNAAVSRG